MKFKNVAISGDIGTGKSTLARLLSEKLDWEYISAGNYFREWYAGQGMDVSKVYGIPEEEDRKMEADFKKEMAEKSGVVFESRLAGWLAKDYAETLKVLCTVEDSEAYKRVAKRDSVTEEEAKNLSVQRAKDLVDKFNKLYGVSDFLDPKYFDLVIDTTKLKPEEVLQKVLEKLAEKE
jgi:predicted cytidylate kinase